jgi:DNA-binding transcriptional LysR family regulator
VVRHGGLLDGSDAATFTPRDKSHKMNNTEHFDLMVRTMDLGDLQIFRTVVSEGGVTRAAERLNRVQSNITTRVRQLEDDLGVPLFIREGKRLHLSPTGKILLDYADRLLDLAQEARIAVRDNTPRGPLRLGAMESTAAIRLPGPLSEFHRRYPDVRLDLSTRSIKELTDQVLSGALDAALVAEPIADDFEKAVIYNEELVLIAPAGHPVIRSPRDVESETVLAFEHGCPYRLRLQQWFARAGVLPARIVEMSSWHAIIGCATARMGIAILPKIVLATFPQKNFLSLHPLPRELNNAPTVLVWRKGARSPKISALIEVLNPETGRRPRRKKT